MNLRSGPLALASVAVLLSSSVAVRGQGKGRPLAIEDYYRVLTVTNPQISPDGRSVRFSVTTRVEADNSTKTETFTVPTDSSAPPTKVANAPGEGGAAGGRGGRGGVGGARVTSPDGKWIARTQEKPQPKVEPKYASDFSCPDASSSEYATWNQPLGNAGNGNLDI